MRKNTIEIKKPLIIRKRRKKLSSDEVWILGTATLPPEFITESNDVAKSWCGQDEWNYAHKLKVLQSVPDGWNKNVRLFCQ